MHQAFCYTIEVGIYIKQGISGVLINGDPYQIPFNSYQMVLANDKNPESMNKSWDMVCDICVDNGFIDPRGNMNIDYIYINGLAKRFH